MIKRATGRALAATVLLSGVAAVPGVIAEEPPLRLAACGDAPGGGGYATCAASTVNSKATAMIQYRRPLTVVTTVSSAAAGTAPTGEVAYTLATSSPGCTAPAGSNAQLEPGPEPTISTAAFPFPTEAEPDCTYRVTTSYAGDEGFGSSSDDTVYVTVKPRATRVGTGYFPGELVYASLSADPFQEDVPPPDGSFGPIYFFDTSTACTNYRSNGTLPPNDRYTTREGEVSTAAASRDLTYAGAPRFAGAVDYFFVRYTVSDPRFVSSVSGCNSYQ